MKLIYTKHNDSTSTTSLYCLGMPLLRKMQLRDIIKYSSFGVPLLIKHKYTCGGGGATLLFGFLPIFSPVRRQDASELIASTGGGMIGERELDSLFLFESDRLFALLRGLNDKDKARVLRQLYIISHSSGSYIKKYVPKSDEEKEGIKRLKDLRAGIKTRMIEGKSVYEYDGMFLPINSFEASVFLYHHLLDKCVGLDKAKAVIDAGGYIGDSALVFTKKCGISGQIYSFEPVSENFSLMQETIALNSLSNVTPVKKALGAKAGEAKISICDIASGFGHGEHLPVESVEVTTIDDFVRENDLQVGLIKSDVEGFEMELLKGTLTTIKTQRPFMIISIYHSLKDYLGIKPFLEALSKKHNLGYHFSIDKGIDEYAHIDTCLYCVPGR